jgi:hypothetical protein
MCTDLACNSKLSCGMHVDNHITLNECNTMTNFPCDADYVGNTKQPMLPKQTAAKTLHRTACETQAKPQNTLSAKNA